MPLPQHIRGEAAQLRRELALHNQRYYVLDDPLISDAEYDRVMGQLLDLERQYPELRGPLSPTQKIGAPPLARFASARHASPMLSLSNVLSREEMREFHERLQRFLPGPDLVQRLTRKQPAILHHKTDGVGVADIIKGVLFQDDEVGQLARLKTAQILTVADHLSPMERGTPERFHGCQTAAGPAPVRGIDYGRPTPECLTGDRTQTCTRAGPQANSCDDGLFR